MLLQAENEYQRARNQELVKLQEESAIRQEQTRRATEEQIQAQRLQTEREKAEIERETIRVRAMAEAEGRAHEAKLAEEVNRRILVDRANAEREKWVAAINTTFDHIGGIKSIICTQSLQEALNSQILKMTFSFLIFSSNVAVTLKRLYICYGGERRQMTFSLSSLVSV